jgi:TfoX/Sxy family transcriptional regulator of competence genes
VAYDEGLAERIREELGDEPGLVEKAMFGGVAFLLDGNMSVGIIGDDLLVRVGPAGYEAALQRPYARVFDMTGRPMKGWVVVESIGLEDDDAFTAWVREGVAFARSLPAK